MLGAILGDQWPELLGVLFTASQSPESGLRETAFRIFTSTPGIIERQHEDTVLEVFTKGFKDDNISVRQNASVNLAHKSIMLTILGANCCHGSLLCPVPLNLQEIPAQVYASHAGPSQHLAPNQGIL